MKKTTRKAMKVKAEVKRPKATIKTPKGTRAQASRRAAEGKFTKIVFNKIGGMECPRFAAMTWAERDIALANPENAAVRDRYEAHMASVGAK